MKLIIVRHGETQANVENTLQGQTGGGLTARGRQQVIQVARRLKFEPIDVIFSSDLKRAKETTREISRFHECPVYFTPAIREWHVGVLSGQPVEKLRHALETDGGWEMNFKPHGGESVMALTHRADAFIRLLFKTHPEKCILIASHGMIIRTMLGILLKRKCEEAFALAQDNACVNILEQNTRKKFNARLINCTRHLKTEEYGGPLATRQS